MPVDRRDTLRNSLSDGDAKIRRSYRISRQRFLLQRFLYPTAVGVIEMILNGNLLDLNIQLLAEHRRSNSCQPIFA